MDMEGADGRSEVAGDAAARATSAFTGCARASRARMLHLRARILWRPTAQ